MRGGPPRPSVLLAAVLVVALTVSAAQALHQNSPGAIRVTPGVPVVDPPTQSWGFQVPFSSTEDLARTGSSGRQIFVFGLFNYDCQHLLPGPGLACPTTPQPIYTQVTSGPGNPDNPSVTTGGAVVAFDADGAYAGGTGPGVGHRQIFLKDLTTNLISRITDAPDGDSVRPSLTTRAVCSSSNPRRRCSAGGPVSRRYSGTAAARPRSRRWTTAPARAPCPPFASSGK